MTTNETAFLAMVRHAEGTDLAPDPYRVCFGYRHTIVSLADHPAVTGEWLGERITVGRFAGEFSTAAGAYQIIKPTWVSLKKRLWLVDFSASSQDSAALELVREAGASTDLALGTLEAVINACHDVWASLPGSLSGQPQRTLISLSESYQGAGGMLA